MKLFRRKPPELTRRQRILHDNAPVAPTLSYFTRRSDQEVNTGRKLKREAVRPALRGLGSYWLQRFGLVILLIVGVIGLINVLTLTPNPKIISLSVVNSQLFLRDQATYQQAAAKLLGSSVWNKNKITVNTGSISEQLTQQFPELSAASVTLPLLSSRPIVYVQPAEPAIILRASNGSYVLDTTGKALMAESSSADDAGLPIVTDESGLSVSLNHEALTAANVSFIQTVVAELKARQVTVATLSLPSSTSELDAQLSGQHYFIKFNLQSNDAQQQAGTFLAVQNKLHSENITSVKYVDVRVDGRAYYQ